MSKRQKTDSNQVFSGLAKELHELVTNKSALRNACDKFLTNLVDEFTLGVIFDYHRKYKTRAIDLDAKNCTSGETFSVEALTSPNVKKTQDCVCPICDKSVGASRFAPHLEVCMGMGKSRLRIARRSVTTSNNKEKDNNINYIDTASDEDDWNPRDKRKKKKERNGKKKQKGTPTKKGDSISDQLTVDIEGDDDDLSGLRDLLQDHSNSSSPAESVSSSHSSNSAKKRDRSRNKKKKDRNSPNPSICND